MADEWASPKAPVVRNAALLVGFLLLVTIGVATVLIPALEDEPGPTPDAEQTRSAEPR